MIVMADVRGMYLWYRPFVLYVTYRRKPCDHISQPLDIMLIPSITPTTA
jgi:hypothetical protein